MTERGGGTDSTARIPRSRLYDYVNVADADQRDATEANASGTPSLPKLAATSTDDTDAADRRRRQFAALLGEFRRTAVLVPVDDDAPLTADFGGIRWIYAFSHESALARFALARGEGDREWPYQRWLGARLLDAAVPAVGVPCGVALDVGSEGEEALFPPVTGIVPDAAAVDQAEETNGEIQR